MKTLCTEVREKNMNHEMANRYEPPGSSTSNSMAGAEMQRLLLVYLASLSALGLSIVSITQEYVQAHLATGISACAVTLFMYKFLSTTRVNRLELGSAWFPVPAVSAVSLYFSLAWPQDSDSLNVGPIAASALMITFGIVAGLWIVGTHERCNSVESSRRRCLVTIGAQCTFWVTVATTSYALSVLLPGSSE